MSTPRRTLARCAATTEDPVGARATLLLHCTLPAGHLSVEHYDAVLARVWVHPDTPDEELAQLAGRGLLRRRA